MLVLCKPITRRKRSLHCRSHQLKNGNGTPLLSSSSTASHLRKGRKYDTWSAGMHGLNAKKQKKNKVHMWHFGPWSYISWDTHRNKWFYRGLKRLVLYDRFATKIQVGKFPSNHSLSTNSKKRKWNRKNCQGSSATRPEVKEFPVHAYITRSHSELVTSRDVERDSEIESPN